MQPVSQKVTSLDLQKIRQQNDESLLTRATGQMGAELKAGASKGVSQEEKLTAGQTDEVQLAPKDKSKSSVKPQVKTQVKTPESPDKSSEESAKETDPPTPPSDGSQPPSSPSKIEYTDSQKAFLARLEELDSQAKTLRTMWRKIYMDWLDDQLKQREDMENFRQATGQLWTDVCVSRWVQGARHSEAVRGLL